MKVTIIHAERNITPILILPERAKLAHVALALLGVGDTVESTEAPIAPAVFRKIKRRTKKVRADVGRHYDHPRYTAFGRVLQPEHVVKIRQQMASFGGNLEEDQRLVLEGSFGAEPQVLRKLAKRLNMSTGWLSTLKMRALRELGFKKVDFV